MLMVMVAAQFELIGGHPVLDFVNTVDWRGDPSRRRDLLVTFQDLLTWAKTVNLADIADARAMSVAAQRDQAGATRSLQRARRLREVLARLLAAEGDSRPAARDLRLLNAFLSAAMRHRHLELRGAVFAWGW